MEVFLLTFCSEIVGGILTVYIIRYIDKLIKVHKNNRPVHK